MKCQLPLESLEGSWMEREAQLLLCVSQNIPLRINCGDRKYIHYNFSVSLNSTFSLVQERHNCSILDFVIASSHITNVHVTEIVI